ncbi:protein MNN4-like [Cucumis melo var. makuwa]|uniref:Protein MNN4-like n=1 Tax=Cucumis melo var. makuwa TaxID=1194695 RepID=A0A5A7TZE0_CUCMM|nr:protein MNN4-like [Cucumis melo var. makuwa]TYK28291.1 protein MNN4-like [Cucumis melo var. makuwa]
MRDKCLLPIVESEFYKVARKAQEKTEKLKKRLLKIKVKAQGVKALAEEKKERKEKTTDEYSKEFEKELEELSPLEDRVVEKQPKKKRVLEGQDAMKREKKNKTVQREQESQKSEQEGVLFAEELGKHFMIEKGIFPFKGQLPLFLTSPIKALKWKQFFEGVTTIRPSVMNLFYNGSINTERHYAIVKGKMVNFGPKVVNVLYGLRQTTVEYPIFKEPSDIDMQNALERVAWPGMKWDITPIKKYQLFPHNLKTTASVWLVFIKKNLMPTRHDNTISLERIMLLYCIMEEIPLNVDEIIYEPIEAWV